MLEEYKSILESIGLGSCDLEEAPEKPPFNHNIFIWWRRFGTHNYLKSTSHVIEKSKNGDFVISKFWKEIRYEYWYLAQDIKQKRLELGYISKRDEREIIISYNKRIRKLEEDAFLDDEANMKELFASLKRNYGGTIEDARKFVETFEGEETIDEAVQQYPQWLEIQKLMK